MRPLHTAPLLLLSALACQAAPPQDTSAEAKKAIDAANATWASLTSSGHADSLASYYHANAVLLPPNMAPVHGREAIRGFFAHMNPSPAPTLKIWSDSVWASGSSAVEQGRWHFAFAPGAKRPPGAPAADSGKYIVRWVNEGGRWLMAQDIWNSDSPLPMAPAAPNPKKS
jgi:ketosteroid isomerase-like protein